MSTYSITRPCRVVRVVLCSLICTGAWVAMVSCDAAEPTGTRNGVLRVTFVVDPGHTEATARLRPAPVVAVQDAAGRLSTTMSVPVTISLSLNQSGATLRGTTTVDLIDGTARFDDLWIDRPGSYTLVATGPRVLADTSSEFRVKLTAREIAAGGRHTCAITVAAATYCWGINAQGQVGSGLPDVNPYPVLVETPASVELVRLSAGRTHTCALSGEGRAYCWGEAGRPGYNLEFGEVPVTAAPETRFTTISSRGEHNCAVTRTGSAYCWGNNSHGKLGDGTDEVRSDIVRVAVPSDVRFRQVEVSKAQSCGVAEGGALYCWGWASGPMPKTFPTPAGTRPIEILVGSNHRCLRTDMGIYCWGANSSGQLGDGSFQSRFSFAPVHGEPPGGFKYLSVGPANNCGVSAEGRVYCWGDGTAAGHAQDTDDLRQRLPTEVALPEGIRFIKVTTSSEHACALSDDGKVFCWGENRGGRLGNGDSSGKSILPVQIVQ